MDTPRAEDDRIAALEAEIRERHAELARLRRERPRETVGAYRFRAPAGATVTLIELFEHHDDLLVVHNMGTACHHCTLWADGFNGLLPHLEDRTAFVVVSPDSPVTQQAFAEQRGWRFRMVSNGDSSFTEDMGFLRERNGAMSPFPGVSAFRRASDGTIERVAAADFGEGDPYCAAWHLFALLPDPPTPWSPRSTYGGPGSERS